VLFDDTHLGYFSANAALVGATFPDDDSFHYAKVDVVIQSIAVKSRSQKLCKKTQLQQLNIIGHQYSSVIKSLPI
jgi:hypothetical protein